MSKWTGKIIGGGVGWALLGPLGALVGAAVGNRFDQKSERDELDEIPYDYYRDDEYLHRHRETFESNYGGSFAVAMLALFATVIRADGTVSGSEVRHVREFLVRQFGSDEAASMMQMFKEILQKQYDLQEITAQIVAHMGYHERLEMCHFLFALAMADGTVSQAETRTILSIGAQLGISEPDLRAVFGSSRPGSSGSGGMIDPYEVLGMSSSASNEELKKAYRDLAKKFHPDRVQTLGEEYREFAEEKFKKLQAAWEQIRKVRGI